MRKEIILIYTSDERMIITDQVADFVRWQELFEHYIAHLVFIDSKDLTEYLREEYPPLKEVTEEMITSATEQSETGFTEIRFPAEGKSMAFTSIQPK